MAASASFAACRTSPLARPAMSATGAAYVVQAVRHDAAVLQLADHLLRRLLGDERHVHEQPRRDQRVVRPRDD